MSGDSLPPGVLVAFYGDDFTGSTDAMEALAFAGLPTVLFLDQPDAAMLAAFAHCRGIGIAGTARSRPPAWMDEQLPAVYRTLADLKPQLIHYKVCSTFDSSPTTGSIGRAIDLGLETTGARWAACFSGAPHIGRYQVFGNLFAAAEGVVHRIDRHPTMSRHPVTPMREGDLRLHLAAQTRRPIGLVDILALQRGKGSEALHRLRAEGTEAIFFDALDPASFAAVGQTLWENRDSLPGGGLFAAASSGILHALIAYWRERGLLPASAGLPPADPVERLLAVSGSCSPITAGQIVQAEADGFVPVALSGAALLEPPGAAREIERAVAAADRALAEGRDVLVFSARGPDDPAVAALSEAAERAGLPLSDAQERVAEALGRVLKELLARHPLPRVAVAGGDTSGAVTSRLGLIALEAFAPMTPGAPLCRGHRRQGGKPLEIVLKGGQMGGRDFFARVKTGGRQP